jgi:hypothetical protein
MVSAGIGTFRKKSGVAGLHRASPSAALDKSAAQRIFLSFLSENLYLIIRIPPHSVNYIFSKIPFNFLRWDLRGVVAADSPAETAYVLQRIKAS